MTDELTRLIVPALDEEPWPTLGPEVCDWLEAFMVHGPGDVLGDPIELTDEERFLLYRAYEVYPKGDTRGRAGRRRFKRVIYSRRKGARKTELASWMTIAESHPEAPVRCTGFHQVEGEWVPVGSGIRDPYIPMLATTEEQVEDLAYGAVYAILTQESCPLVDEYDVTLERVIHRSAGGKTQALAGSPSARDGARTSFQHFDEPHLFFSPRLRRAHATMLRNIPKRILADAWSFETTTMYGPGEGSIAEDVHEYARAIERGAIKDPTLLFDHRQASEKWDITKPRQRQQAIIEASGDAIEWADVPTISAQGAEAILKGEENEWRRYWLNQPRRSSSKWHPVVALWGGCKAENTDWPAEETEVVLFFDGSYSRDSTALIGATVAEKPFVFEVKTWEKPPNSPRWRTPRTEVDDEVDDAMEHWTVLELAPDPPGWHREIEEWEQTYGEVVVRFDTNQPSRMGPACDDFTQAVSDGELTHDGSEVITRHLNNAVPAKRRGHTVITKEADDSPNKIDAAVGAVGAYHRARWHWTNNEEAVIEGSLMVGPSSGG